MHTILIKREDREISLSQGGFRPFRSTADVVWAHRWYATKAALAEIDIHVTGMSSAFDTRNRKLMFGILQDELRLERFLLSDTGVTEDTPFFGNVGTRKERA